MPPDFLFAIKGSRYITHMLKLRNFEAPLGNFFAQGILLLGASWARSCGSCRRA